MTMEADLATLLRTVCPRVAPDVAEIGTARPYITYQGIGGDAWRYQDNTAADRRHSVMQVSVWSETRAEALVLIRAVETALCAATVFTATPYDSEPRWTSDQVPPDIRLYGCIQDFEIVSLR